jgi:Protein of unknown function (DUF2510)
MAGQATSERYVPGWKRDPFGGNGYRWHNGKEWTEEVADALPVGPSCFSPLQEGDLERCRNAVRASLQTVGNLFSAFRKGS